MISRQGGKRREDARAQAGRLCALQKLRKTGIALSWNFARSALGIRTAAHMNRDRPKGNFEKFCDPIKVGVFVRL